jgi:hypothetical protein
VARPATLDTQGAPETAEEGQLRPGGGGAPRADEVVEALCALRARAGAA